MRLGVEFAALERVVASSVGQIVMRTYSRSGLTGLSVRSRVSRWWSTHAVATPREVVVQAAMASFCFVALLFGMTFVKHANANQLVAEQFRDRNIKFAEIQDAGEVLRGDENTSELLKHDWLRTVEYSLERNPSSALSRHAAYERDGAALSGLESFKAVHMSKADEISRQSKCLAQAIYYEARSEHVSGQIAVAEVIMNRVLDHRYPSNICDVVFQGATRTTGCQFTFTCDGAMESSPRGQRWSKAELVASHVMMGLSEKRTSGATHYHATYVDPVWSDGLIRTNKIGTHIFYRFPRGGEWTMARARLDRRMSQRRSGLSAITPASASTTVAQSKFITPASNSVGTTGTHVSSIASAEQTASY